MVDVDSAPSASRIERRHGRQPPAEDFRRDSDLFGEGVRNAEAQQRLQAAMKRGFQTRDGEMALGRLLGELNEG
jgi:hypothetical protein